MMAPLTVRMRKVMQLADREARRFNHEYLGTEHLLLALLREGGGVGCDVLRGLGIDLGRVDREVNAIVQPGPDVDNFRQPERRPQTPRARTVMELAVEEARGLGHLDAVGTGHLLLGLVREDQGVAAQVLLGLGVASSPTRLNDLRSRVAAEQERAADDAASRPAVELTDQEFQPWPLPPPPVPARSDLLKLPRMRPTDPVGPSGLSIVLTMVCAIVLGLGITTHALLYGQIGGVAALIGAMGFCIVVASWMPKRSRGQPGADGIDRHALWRLLEREMTVKFGPIDEKRREEIRQWDEGRLAEAKRRLSDARSLDDLM